MKTIKTILIVVLLTGLISCNNDFLDEQPSDSSDATMAVQNVDDAEVMLTGIMRGLTSVDYYGRNFLLYGDAKGGMLTTATFGRGMSNLLDFKHTPTSGSQEGYWNTIYNNILQANNLIQNINNIVEEGSEDDYSDVLGQALTSRALMYYDLVRLYGLPYDMDKSSYGVPLELEPLEATAQPLRASVEEVYNQIVKDLTDAAELLSKDKNNGYLNYYANKAIQARVAMNMQEYGKALSDAEEIINDGPYELYSNNEWIDSWSEQYGKESIFELNMAPTENDLGNSSLSIYYRKRQQLSSSAAGQFIASDYYLDLLGEDPDDVRWSMMDEDELGRLGASYKYSGNTDLVGDGKSTITAVNIKVIRLSEIYLIAAEAALHSDKQKASDYLNAIRKRAPNLAPSNQSTVDIDMIMDEKTKELFTEGQRFFDYIRLDRKIEFNDDLTNLPLTARDKVIDRSIYNIILPISQNEINANPGIGDQQNPGY